MTSPNKDPRSGSQINSATSYVKRKYPKDYLNHVAEYTEKEMNESVLRCFCGADAELEAGGDDGSCGNFATIFIFAQIVVQFTSRILQDGKLLFYTQITVLRGKGMNYE